MRKFVCQYGWKWELEDKYWWKPPTSNFKKSVLLIMCWCYVTWRGREKQTRNNALTSRREHKIYLYRNRPWCQNTVLQYVPERILQKNKITYGQVRIKAAALCCGGCEVQRRSLLEEKRTVGGREYEKLVTSWFSATCLDHEDLIYEDRQTARLFIADSKDPRSIAPKTNSLTRILMNRFVFAC